MSDPAQANPTAIPTVSREQMQLVLDVARSLAVTPDLSALLTRIARATTTLLGCERASVFIHDAGRNELWSLVALQSDPIRVGVDSGIVGLAFRNNQVIHCPNAYGDARFNPGPDRQSGFVTRNLLAAPMVDCDGKPLGVLQALNKIAGVFSDTDSALLRLLADQAGVAIQRWNLQQEAVKNLGLKHEMALARRVQDAMVPKHPPMLPNLRSAGWTQSASINGGDCYDLWACGDRLGILVADASGHGIAPAMVVSQVRALVRTLCETEPDPCKVLMRINARLAADLEPGRFATAFLAFMSSDGSTQWCSAGHGPMVLCHYPNGARVLDAMLPPLGLIDDEQRGRASAVSLDLEPGASLVAMSDGITEAFDANEDLFGIERVIAALETNSTGDPEKSVAAVRDAVIRWQGKIEPRDDQTLVIVRYDPEAKE
ncbi:MAG TPA: GAF domain-containing SpoIIE family protein phosphatase [Tepidisphaeraceae bacterium]|jgi:phosphoserine phosphatase|nr:GAF domain-containing SpoIIE family protein phosphatase [Tepidisphaeraceae bacterium]